MSYFKGAKDGDKVKLSASETHGRLAAYLVHGKVQGAIEGILLVDGGTVGEYGSAYFTPDGSNTSILIEEGVGAMPQFSATVEEVVA